MFGGQWAVKTLHSLPTAHSPLPTPMRWIWIDKFVEFESGKHAAALKCATLAEDHMHDLYPAFPIVPHSLIVEGMAQTGGMLVGEVRDFREKVILAKITRATFHRIVRPGDTIRFDATVEQMNDTGASITGRVRLANASGTQSLGDDHATDALAEIDMMFSHIDNNMSGMKFPEENFVFTEPFLDLLKTFRRGQNVAI